MQEGESKMADSQFEQIMDAIRSFIDLLEKLEVLIDPNEKTTIDDLVLSFLRRIVGDD